MLKRTAPVACLVAASILPVAAKGGSADLLEGLRHGVAHVGYGSGAGGNVELRWLGSGFLTGRRCTVVTAKHLLADVPPERLIVRFEHPQQPGTALTFNARVSGTDEDRDVAYLSLAELPGGRDPCSSGMLRSLTLAEALPARELLGAEVVVIGFPALEGEQPRELPIVRRGSVASAELSWGGKPMLLLDLTGVPGFSGAPVVLAGTGEVIGIVFGPGRTGREYDLEWATPVLRRDLKAADLD